nr:DUF123 domain-containing protein [Methanocella sp. CWC-04]
MHLKKGQKLKVGAIGDIYFDEGYYAYTGSALGRSGYARVRRHLNVASGKNATRRWHIDYLLPYVEVIDIITSPRPECSVAESIDGVLSRISGFGCSDCKCLSHLHFSNDMDVMMRVVRESHRI